MQSLNILFQAIVCAYNPGALFFDCPKWSFTAIAGHCHDTFFGLYGSGKCDSITIYKCHFRVSLLFRLWKSFIQHSDTSF